MIIKLDRVTNNGLLFVNIYVNYMRIYNNGAKGLFEIRAKGQAGIARGFFCSISKQAVVILHVFIKKT
jgi:phage-related protein